MIKLTLTKRALVFWSFLFLTFTVATAQQAGSWKTFNQQGSRIAFALDNGLAQLDFCTPGMFRVQLAWDKKIDNNEPWMVTRYNWDPVRVTAQKTTAGVLLQTSQLDVKVYSSPFRIEVFSKEGKLISSDKTGGGVWKQGDKVGCTRQLQPQEHFFGFGERMDFMDRRNQQVSLNVGRGKGRPHIIGAYNVLEANYSPVPFFMSTQGYGIFFHNSFATQWDMGSDDPALCRFEAAGGPLDYYFIYGPQFASILEQYTALTGRSPLMPRFALGLHVGTYSGGTWGHEEASSDTYVIALARKLREMGVPVDLLWLDSTWRIFGKNGGKGATSFEWRETFKDPAAMFDSIYAMHYKMAGLHLRPRFDNGNRLELLDTAQQLGYTYPEDGKPGEFVNFFDSNAVNWWWQHGVMRVATQGAMFLKTDEGSAFGALANESEKVGPTGKEAQRLHNVFPVAYAKAPYEKFQAYNGMRGMNQTREGYAGIQRYPFIFAGDWPSEWQYFEPVIKAGLNIGLSGVGDWAHCMGGFETPADPELYMRWCQFGMFSPVALVFGMDHPGYKEPWNYGEEAFRNFVKYDSLRYRLMPYLYTYQYRQYKTGMPLMRALVLAYQDDPNVYDISDEYLLGDDLLVCPVTTKGAQTRVVYLPRGNWRDYYTGQLYTGKQYYNIVSPADVLPLFVKEGAVIPMQPGMKYTDEKPVDRITLDIYPAAAVEFNLYEDDGLSLGYQQGQYSMTSVQVAQQAKEVTIHIGEPAGSWQPLSRTYLAVVRLDAPPAGVLENNRPVKALPHNPVDATEAGWYYEEAGRRLWIQTTGSSKQDIQLLIKQH